MTKLEKDRIRQVVIAMSPEEQLEAVLSVNPEVLVIAIERVFGGGEDESNE